MSITLKHLDGPLKADPRKGEQDFDDSASSILIGRSAEALIAYPEECTGVGDEHLRLNRDTAGDYTIEICGSGDVEIDGRPAETGTKVTSGSVITVGEDGPRLQVLLPGVTIKHLEGPLAGQHQYFPDGVGKIVFGRPPENTDVAYPPNYTKVGRSHFSLKRKDLGDYCVELTPDHYVEIDGAEADNGALVPSGSIFRLGHDDGPTFSAFIEKPKGAGAVTEINKPQTPVRKELQKTNETLRDTKKQGLYALGAVMGVLLAVVGWATYRDIRHDAELRQLAADLTAAEDRVSALAAKSIPDSAQQALQDAVYLVAKKEGGDEIGQATAWAFAPDKLATNAHVTEAIKGHEKEFILISPNKELIAIKSVASHPGYTAFKTYKVTLGRITGDNFEPLNVINEYDVGIIEIDPSTPLPADPATGKPVTLELASEDHLKELKPGAAVASVGYPIEGMAASMVVTEAPSALRFGNISSLTDVFMCRAEPDHRLLIQHGVPVTGGVSGSPLIDASGKVIGIVSGGNTVSIVKGTGAAVANGAPKDKQKPANETARIPSAALINFAQRIDLLEDLIGEEAERQLASDQDYWKSAAQKFASYFTSAARELVALAGERYAVGDAATKQEIGSGTLTPRKAGVTSFVSATHKAVLEPGHVYGFIADSKNGVRIALNVKKEGSSEFLKDEKDPRQTSVSELAPTAWVTVKEQTPVDIDVFSLTAQPADYVLYVYDWAMPAETPAADASY